MPVHCCNLYVDPEQMWLDVEKWWKEGWREPLPFCFCCKAQRALTEGNCHMLAQAGDRVLLSGRRLFTLQETTGDQTFCVLVSGSLLSTSNICRHWVDTRGRDRDRGVRCRRSVSVSNRVVASYLVPPRPSKAVNYIPLASIRVQSYSTRLERRWGNDGLW
jgi:hypothetical protein